MLHEDHDLFPQALDVHLRVQGKLGLTALNACARRDVRVHTHARHPLQTPLQALKKHEETLQKVALRFARI